MHVRFPSVDELVETEAGTTPLAQEVSEQAIVRITERSRALLSEFLAQDGTMRMPIDGCIVVGR